MEVSEDLNEIRGKSGSAKSGPIRVTLSVGSQLSQPAVHRLHCSVF